MTVVYDDATKSERTYQNRKLYLSINTEQTVEAVPKVYVNPAETGGKAGMPEGPAGLFPPSFSHPMKSYALSNTL